MCNMVNLAFPILLKVGIQIYNKTKFYPDMNNKSNQENCPSFNQSKDSSAVKKHKSYASIWVKFKYSEKASKIWKGSST